MARFLPIKRRISGLQGRKRSFANSLCANPKSEILNYIKIKTLI